MFAAKATIVKVMSASSPDVMLAVTFMLEDCTFMLEDCTTALCTVN